jgi:hypothetical protein
MINPVEGDTSIQIYSDQFFNLRFSVTSSTITNDISVAVDGTTVRTMNSGNSFVIPINDARNMPPGNHTITIRALDDNKQQVSKSLQFNILPR